MLNASHSQMNRAALSAESTKSTPPLYFGWLATMPTARPRRARARDELLREELLDLDEAALVDDRVDDGVHVERLVLVGGDHLLERLLPWLRRPRLGAAARPRSRFCGMSAR